MMKYNIIVHYEGAWSFEIEAENVDKAKEIAEDKFADLDADELMSALADSYVCDYWEI